MLRSIYSRFLVGALLALVCSGADLPAADVGATGVRKVAREGWFDLGDARDATHNPATKADPVQVLTASANLLELALVVPGIRLSPIKLPDGHTFTRVAAAGSTFVEAGMPSVPAFGRWILIPNGTRAKVEVDPGEPVVIQDLNLEPVQPRRGQSLDAPSLPFTINETVFGRDADSPGIFARLEPTKIMRGQPCTVLWIYPFQYNPVQRTLSAYPDLRVTVRFEGEVEPLPVGLKDEGFEAAQRRLAVNAEATLAAQEETARAQKSRSGREGRSLETQTGWDYIIVSRLEFAAAGERLAAWKRKIGFRPFHLWFSGAVPAEDIRTIIKNWYDTMDIRPRYVLIIGDADDIPCFYQTPHPYESYPQGQGTQGYIGTDLYYGTLDGFDVVADVGVGRLPVDSEAQALDWVERIIAYEQDPPVLTNFYENVAIAAYFQDSIFVDGYEDNRFVQTAEDLAKFLSEYAYGVQKTVTRIYNAEPTATPTHWSTGQHQNLDNFGGGPAGEPAASIPSYLLRPGFAWDGDSADLAGAIEPGAGSGSFLVVHRDHGNRQWWSHPFFYPIDIANLDINYGESPVIWSINCQTGWFDNETDFPYTIPAPGSATADNEESFVEFFGNYCNVGGPVGLIGATRISDTIYNDRLTWGFVDALWTWFVSSPFELAPNYKMGDVLNFGKAYMTNNVPDDEWRLTHLEEYHWFGDPAMEIRTRHPDWLASTAPAVWPWMGVAHDLVVHVENGGGPVEDAQVTLSHPTSTFEHWTGWTNAGGDVIFAGLVTSEAGTYDLVATASNNVPWIGTMFSAGADLIFHDDFESGDTSAWWVTGTNNK